MLRRFVAPALLLALACGSEDALSPADIPEGAPPIDRFDGEWLSEDFGYAVSIQGRMGTVTFSNGGANPVGGLLLVIQSEDGLRFEGLQLFRDGVVREVIGRLVEPNTLRMTGNRTTWDLQRVGADDSVSPEDIPADAPPISTFDGEWLSEDFGYAMNISGRLGTVTLSDSPVNPPGELILVIQSDEGARFDGLHVFRDGLVEEVIGRLTEPNLLRMTGDRMSWDLQRISNAAPVANAGMSLASSVGALVTLDGSLSSDPDPDDVLSYTWTQEFGDPVTLGRDDAPVVTFLAPRTPQLLEFRLTVRDPEGAEDSAIVVVTVLADTI